MDGYRVVNASTTVSVTGPMVRIQHLNGNTVEVMRCELQQIAQYLQFLHVAEENAQMAQDYERQATQ